MAGDSSHMQISNLFDVKDRVALVTGGGSGIGLMCVQALAANGAKVYITGRTASKLSTVVDTHGPNVAGQIIPLEGDITSKDSVKNIVQEISSREKHLDILINNAGVAGNTQSVPSPSSSSSTDSPTMASEFKKSLFDPDSATYDDWATTYKTNVVSLYMLTTAFLPLLAASTASPKNKGYSAAVINITSISGSVAKSQSHFSYNASKAAANHITKLLATEISNAGVKVRVNAIAPGVFPSEMTTGKSGEDMKSEIGGKGADGQREGHKYEDLPAGRPGRDEDMGNAVLFLVTNQYLNGQVVPVDGGYLLKYGQMSL